MVFPFSLIILLSVIIRFSPNLAGRGSSVGCESFWLDAGGPGFHPHVQHVLPWRFGHEKLSTDILFLPLIQKGQLSVTGETMGTKYLKTA